MIQLLKRKVTILVSTLLLIALPFLFNTCDLINNEPLGLVKGVIIDSCTGLPSSGITIEYWKNPKDSEDLFEAHFSEEKLQSTETDSSGFFSFEILDQEESASIRVKKGQASGYLASGFIWPDDDGDLDLDTLLRHGFLSPVEFTIQNKEPFAAADRIVAVYPDGFQTFLDTLVPEVGKTSLRVVLPINFYSLVYDSEHDLGKRSFVGKAKFRWLINGNDSEEKWFYVHAKQCENQNVTTRTVKYW